MAHELRDCLSAIRNEPRPQSCGTLPRRSPRVTARRHGRDAIMAITNTVGIRPMREETIAAGIERLPIRVPPRGIRLQPNAIERRLNCRLVVGRRSASARVCCVRVRRSKLLPAYLYHLRYSQRWKSHHEQRRKRQRPRAHLLRRSRPFALQLPPVDVQARVARALDAASEEITLLKRSAVALRDPEARPDAEAAHWRVAAAGCGRTLSPDPSPASGRGEQECGGGKREQERRAGSGNQKRRACRFFPSPACGRGWPKAGRGPA